MTPEQIAAIAGKLTVAQQDAVVDGRWIYPGGMDPICLVDFNGEPWPQGIAEFFTFRTDRLTETGLAVRRHLQEIDRG